MDDGNFDVSQGEDFQLVVNQLSPTGNLIQVGDGWERPDQVDVIGIEIVWPLTLPAQGILEFTSDQSFVEAPFQFKVWNDPPRISVLPPTSSPETSLFISDRCLVFSRGEQIDLFGFGYPLYQEYVIGVYTEQESQGIPGQLVTTGVIPTDGEGLLSAQITLDDNKPPGLYYIVVIQDPAEDLAELAGQTTCFQVR
jgi:hypothetical protein